MKLTCSTHTVTHITTYTHWDSKTHWTLRQTYKAECTDTHCVLTPTALRVRESLECVCIYACVYLLYKMDG